MNLKRAIYILIALMFSAELAAQYYSTGQDPASIKWKQLESEHFSFIFPGGYEAEAKKTAFVFEKSFSLVGGRYNESEIRKFPVILHQHSIESNGYVAWAPKRVELFPFPGQNTLPLSHIEQLSLHELVHVSQMQSLRKGLSKPLEIILGEQFIGAISVFTPFWFLEGEAVICESIYTNSGRARLPDFQKRIKALLLEKDIMYNYDKMINGSYKDYTPDHYQFGYQMAAYARSPLGESKFPDALGSVFNKPFTSSNIKKSLYDSTMGYLKSQWLAEDKIIEKSDFIYLDMPNNRDYINYYSPHAAGSDTIIAIKTSLSEPPAFVMITENGKVEKKLFTPGYIWPYRFSVAGNIITWAENRSDPRWDNRGYSVIKTYNIKTGISFLLTKRSRLFSPSLSSDGMSIVATETNEDYISSLVILDRVTGKEINRVALPQDILAVYPRWSKDNKKIVFISFGDSGEGVMTYNIGQRSWETLIEASRTDLQSVDLRNDTLFYVSSNSGTDNIYTLMPNKVRYQLTSSRFGLSDISLDGAKMYFTDYSSSGNKIASFPSTSTGKEIEPGEAKPLLLIKEIDSSNKLPEYIDSEDDIYSTSPYRKWKHLFNFHSWMPFYADINNISFDNIKVSPGATIMSQNHLSTLSSSIAYEYQNGDHLFHTGLLWEGQYPAIDFDLRYGGNPYIARDRDSLYHPSSVASGLKAEATIYLPLSFNSGKFNQTLYPSVKLRYSNDYIFDEDAMVFDYGQIMVSGRIYFSNFYRMAHRDIWPRWGQVIDISSTFSPGDRDIYAPVNSIRTTLYTPGIFSNHGVKLMYQAEKQESARFLQYNRVSWPRGYMHIISSNISSYSADYALPIAYPDLNIGNLLYINRIRAGLFYDYTRASDNYYVREQRLVEEKENFVSYGVELISDFYLLRLPFRFSGGIQTAWMPEINEPYFKLIFNINVFGFVIGENSPLH